METAQGEAWDVCNGIIFGPNGSSGKGGSFISAWTRSDEMNNGKRAIIIDETIFEKLRRP